MGECLGFPMPIFSKELAFKGLKNFFTALVLTTASFVGNLLADGWSTPAEERAIQRVQRAWNKKLPAPDQVNAQIVLYKYRDNYSSRCRTETAIFPVGAYPGAGSCTDLGQARSEARDAHLLGSCWDITKADLVPGSGQEAAWNNSEIIASTSCPIERDRQTWGYASISFQEKTLNTFGLINPGFEELGAADKNSRIYLTQKFEEAAETALNKGSW